MHDVHEGPKVQRNEQSRPTTGNFSRGPGGDSADARALEPSPGRCLCPEMKVSSRPPGNPAQ